MVNGSQSKTDGWVDVPLQAPTPAAEPAIDEWVDVPIEKPRVVRRDPNIPWWMTFGSEQLPELAEGTGRRLVDWADQIPAVDPYIDDSYTTKDPSWQPGTAGRIGESIGEELPAAVTSIGLSAGKKAMPWLMASDTIMGGLMPAESWTDRAFNAIAGLAGEPIARGVSAGVKGVKHFGEWAGRRMGFGDSPESVASGVDFIRDRSQLADTGYGPDDLGQKRIEAEEQFLVGERPDGQPDYRGDALEAERRYRKQVSDPAYDATKASAAANEEFLMPEDFGSKMIAFNNKWAPEPGGIYEAEVSQVRNAFAQSGFFDADTPVTYAKAEELRKKLNKMRSGPNGHIAGEAVDMLDEALESGALRRTRPGEWQGTVQPDGSTIYEPAGVPPTGSTMPAAPGTEAFTSPDVPDPVGPNPFKETAPGVDARGNNFTKSARAYAEDMIVMNDNQFFKFAKDTGNTNGAVKALLDAQPKQARAALDFFQANHPESYQLLRNATTLQLAEAFGDIGKQFAGDTMQAAGNVIAMFDSPEKLNVLKHLLEPETFDFMTKKFIPALKYAEGDKQIRKMVDAITPYARLGDGSSPLRFVIALKGGADPGWGDVVALRSAPSKLIQMMDQTWRNIGQSVVSGGLREANRQIQE